MVLQGFIDDSGSGDPQRQPDMVLAGFISDHDNWAKFSDAWQQELNQEPPIEYFKMSEAFHADGQFAGWKEEDIWDRVDQFVQIIKNHGQPKKMVRVSITGKSADFEKYFKGRGPSEINHPYFLCYWGLYYVIAAHAALHRWGSAVDLVFDEQAS